MSTASQRRARERLLRHATACWSTQALGVAVEMDLPDRLGAGPATAANLAADCGAPAEALQRLLRALCALDVCREGSDGRFTLAAGGEALRRDPGAAGPSLRAIVQWWSGPMWSLWPELAYSVRTGHSARERRTGQPGYAFLDDQPEMAATFHQAMQAMTAMVADDIIALDVWRDAKQLVDVGGGNGTLAAAIASAHPHLHASILDRADAQGAADVLIHSRGIASRCRFVVGDFFVEVPAGLDVYLLKSILHNWDDTHCAKLLATLRAALSPKARVLVIERVRPTRVRGSARDEGVVRTDLNMLAGLGGRERTLDEYGALLGEAGLRIDSVSALSFEFSVIELRSANQSISAPPGS